MRVEPHNGNVPIRGWGDQRETHRYLPPFPLPHPSLSHSIACDRARKQPGKGGPGYVVEEWAIWLETASTVPAQLINLNKLMLKFWESSQIWSVIFLTLLYSFLTFTNNKEKHPIYRVWYIILPHDFPRNQCKDNFWRLRNIKDTITRPFCYIKN